MREPIVASHVIVIAIEQLQQVATQSSVLAGKQLNLDAMRTVIDANKTIADLLAVQLAIDTTPNNPSTKPVAEGKHGE